MPTTKQVRVVVIRPQQEPVAELADSSVEGFQKLVGGHFEVYPVAHRCYLVCNEDGKRLGLPKNRPVASDDWFLGTLFIHRVDVDGNAIDLTDTDVKHFISTFALAHVPGL